MTTKTLTGAHVHSAAKMYAEEYKAGHMDRREFMSRATMLGVTSAGAYALIGGAKPAAAAGHAQQGGTLRMEMEVRALKDPRTYDGWPFRHPDRRRQQSAARCHRSGGCQHCCAEPACA